MSFISLSFLVFLGIVFIIYFTVPSKHQWIVLLAASYCFYLFAGIKLVIFLLFTTLSTFYTGKYIGKINVQYHEKLKYTGKTLSRNEKRELKDTYNRQKKKAMIAVLMLNFGILFVLKYLPVISYSLSNSIANQWPGVNIPKISLLLPLGISFYTFQSMAYIVDLYRDKFKPEHNLAKFALFVSFFPQIIQGPISRFDELAEQLYVSHSFDYKRAKFGLELMLWGYIKKMIIADHLTVVTGTIFGNPEKYPGLYLVIGAVFSWIELYTDFSGGIDMSRGTAEVLGIYMPENFKRPFFADSLAEFWRGWHITLNNWWRDYIFYPLTLSKAFTNMGKHCKKIWGNTLGKKMPIMLALLIVRVINSVWHGAYLIYLVGGLYHGIIISLAFFLEPQFKRLAEIFKVNTQCFSWKVFRIIRTFILICMPRLIYTAQSWSEIKLYIRCTFSTFNPWILFDDSLYALGLGRKMFEMLMVFMGILFVVSFLQEKGYCIREKIDEQNLVFRWILYIAGVSAIVFFGVYGLGYDAAGFTYMQF